MSFIERYNTVEEFIDDIEGFRDDALEVANDLKYINELHVLVVKHANLKSIRASNVLEKLNEMSLDLQKQIE